MLSEYQKQLQHDKIHGKKVEKKKAYKIKPESKKRAGLNRQYRKLVKGEAEKDNECQVKSPVCTFFMQGMHHVIKRTEGNLIDMDNLLKCCNSCNRFLEQNDAWAREQGFVKSKFTPSVLIAHHDKEVNAIIVE